MAVSVLNSTHLYAGNSLQIGAKHVLHDDKIHIKPIAYTTPKAVDFRVIFREKTAAYDVCRHFFTEKDRKDTGRTHTLIDIFLERSDPEQNPQCIARVDKMYFLIEHFEKLLADFISQIDTSERQYK